MYTQRDKVTLSLLFVLALALMASITWLAQRQARTISSDAAETTESAPPA